MTLLFRRLVPVILLTLALAPAAFALPQRVFVSSTGSDANPCSRDLPCRNFAAALTAVTAGGEIVVLDSAGYGTILINQSVALVAPTGVYAGISVFTGGVGVWVIANGANVSVRGLTINALGGSSGISVADAANVRIDDVVISNFTAGLGIALSGGSAVSISHAIVRQNSGGIWVYPNAGANSVDAFITDSQVEDSTTQNGIYVQPIAPASATVVIRNTSVVRNLGAGIALHVGGATTADVSVQNCTVAGNGTNGIITDTAGATVRVSNTLVTGQTNGLHNFAGSIVSFGNNQVNGNTTETLGTITTVAQK